VRSVLLRAGIVASTLAACQTAGRDVGTPQRGLLAELNQKSETLTADTIHVVAPAGPDDRYGGTKIDSLHYSTLREPYREGKVGGFYATYRVQLGPGYTGYLLRVPSRYTSSGIDLWIYDEGSRSWRPPLRVADAFGGGSWQYAMDGWLVDIDGDQRRDLVHRGRYWWTDDAFQEHHVDSLFVRPWQQNTFAEPRLSNDTALARVLLPDRWRQ
jgi:hypothetical protein